MCNIYIDMKVHHTCEACARYLLIVILVPTDTAQTSSIIEGQMQAECTILSIVATAETAAIDTYSAGLTQPSPVLNGARLQVQVRLAV